MRIRLLLLAVLLLFTALPAAAAVIARVVALRCGDDAEVMAALHRLTDDDIEGETEVRDAARKALEALQPKTE